MTTTHVFIVDKSTFRYHLEYLFAGTGAKDYVVDFNALGTSTLHSTRENLLASMIADSQRARVGDYVIFYLQQNFQQKIREGKFYGIFKVKEAPSFLDNNDANQFLAGQLGKSLTFRTLIEPHSVYAEGVTEWEALDEIRQIQSPNQMLWSLIYRKLKGNRGNTMITIYESERLRHLIRSKNGGNVLNSRDFSFDLNNQTIILNGTANPYTGRRDVVDILPRLIAKYGRRQEFESHLQAYIVQHLESLSIFQNEQIEWLGNEVSCGVGMQRIDIMVSVSRDDHLVCIPIELKSAQAKSGITIQLQRYVDWIEQYYIPNRPSDIEPMLISRQVQNKNSATYTNLVNEFHAFNARNALRLRYVEFDIDHAAQTLTFTEIIY